MIALQNPVIGRDGLYTYTWVQHPVEAATGMAVVKASAVRSGSINPNDVLQFAFTFPRPIGLWFSKLDGGRLAVDPVSGKVLSGQLLASFTDPTGMVHVGIFEADCVHTSTPEDNANSKGHWVSQPIP
jgi:hypothetical protein